MPAKRREESNPGVESPAAEVGIAMRTSQACDRCRGRKAKCNGDRPSCTRCVGRGANCNYTPRASKRASRAIICATPSVDVKKEVEHHHPLVHYSSPNNGKRASVASSTYSNDGSDRSMLSNDVPPAHSTQFFRSGRVSAKTTSIVEIEAEILPSSMIPAAPSTQFKFPPCVIEATIRQQRSLPHRLNLVASHFNDGLQANQPQQLQALTDQAYFVPPLRHSTSTPIFPPSLHDGPLQHYPQAHQDMSMLSTTLRPAQFPTLSVEAAKGDMYHDKYPRDLALESSLAAYQFPPPSFGANEYEVANSHSPESDATSTGSVGTASWDHESSSARYYQPDPPPVTPPMTGIYRLPHSETHHIQSPFRMLSRSTRSLTTESPSRQDQLTVERNAVWENVPASAPPTQLYHNQSYQLSGISVDTTSPHRVDQNTSLAFSCSPSYPNTGIMSSSPSSSSLAHALEFPSLSHSSSRSSMQYHQPPFPGRERAATFNGSSRHVINQW